MEIHTGEVSEPCSGVSGRLVSGIGQYVSVSVIPVLFLKSSTKNAVRRSDGLCTKVEVVSRIR